MINFANRRVALCATAVAVLALDIFWLPTSKSKWLGFRLETTRSEALIDEKGFAKLPIYNAAKDGWSVAGRVIPTIRPFVEDDDPEGFGSDAIHNHVIVRLGPQAGAGTAQRAFVKLASEGVCQVAIASEQVSRFDQFHEAEVIRIVETQDASGVVTCQDRVN